MLLKLSRNVANTMLKRRISIHNASRPIILGIETSCDDTAVAIVSADKKVLASRILVNREIERQFDGIVPGLSAIQHRSNIDRLVDECLDDVMCRVSDLDAIAVTTTPGMVICLKVGIEKAISLARLGRRPIIPVHHMRAHALSARLVDENVHFPFLTLLISGGHTILAVAHGPSDFDVIGIANGISAGECIDKVGREHHNPTKEHVGALVEQSAVFPNPVEEWIIEFKGPFAKGADFNFEAIKTCFLSFFENYRGDTYEMEYGCPSCYLKAWPDGGLISANLLFHVSNHLCQKLHVGMDFPPVKEIFKDCLKTLVVSGGVAANQFILDKIKKIADFHGFQTVIPPKNLCTDNAEMIAWTGIEIMNKNSSEIIPFENLPSSIYAHGRSEIGTSKLRQKIIDQGFKPKRKIRSRSLLTDRLSFSGKPINKI